MAKSLGKQGLVWGLRELRRVAETEAALWATPVAKLEALAVPAFTEAERARIAEHLAGLRADPRAAITADELAQLAAGLGLARTGTKLAVLERIRRREAQPAQPGAPEPDEDQRAALERCSEGAPRLYLHAGPGAGKTTTVVAAVAQQVAAAPSARVLVLAYNRAARAELQRRLRARGAAPLGNAEMLAGAPGAYVATFDQYCHHATAAAAAAGGSAAFEDVFAAEGPAGAASPPGGGEAPSAGESGGTPRAGPADDYRLALERALRALREGRGAPEALRWDAVVVDEAQDLTTTHAAVVELLEAQEPAPRLLAAGDPRQEVYPDTGWFARRWAAAPAEERATLRYNHRAAPPLVELLNLFSRANFPQLHCEQIAARAAGGGGGHFELVAVQREQCPRGEDWRAFRKQQALRAGRTVGKRLALYAPGEAYGLAPVTTQRFGFDAMTLGAHQAFYERHPGAAVERQAEGGDREPAGGAALVFGTARGLKGTERGAVVVYGLAAPFRQYCGLAHAQLVKLCFVALSRARDALHVVLEGPLPDGHPLACLGAGAPAPPPRLRAQPPELAVTDFARSGHWAPAVCAQAAAPAVDLGAVQGDADFVGLYLEALLAEHLGLLPEGGAEGGADPDPAFAYAARNFTRRIGRPWTVSHRPAEELERLRAAAAPAAAWLRAELGPGAQYQRERRWLPATHRSALRACALAGVTDFESPRALVEVKAVRELAPEHRRQAAAYATARGLPEAVLYNLRDGAVERVAAAPPGELGDLCRAHCALQGARAAGARLPAGARRARPAAFCAACCVSVDVETDWGGRLVEVGAVAFSGEGEVFGVFHRVSAGAAEAPDNGTVLPEVGLAVADAAALAADQAAAVAALAEWVAGVSGVRSFLHWGGKEPALLGLAGQGACLDALKVFRAVPGAGRRGFALADAVGQTLGPSWPFAAHRAFEDALAAAAVFLAVTEPAHVL